MNDDFRYCELCDGRDCDHCGSPTARQRAAIAERNARIACATRCCVALQTCLQQCGAATSPDDDDGD